jgi:signal transduction histidine kinase/CheY-like chemotaxis protein
MELRDRTDGEVAEEARSLRRTYLVALSYPFWHLAAPDGARDPWILWWLVASSFAAVAALSLWSSWVARRLRHLFPLCSWLVTLHLYGLAVMNEMRPFYVVGSALAVVTTVVFIRDRRGLLAYMALVAALTLTLYELDPSAEKLAYWGGLLTLMPLAYVRLDLQMRREALARRMAAELEARVEERTRELHEANERLQEEMAERERLESRLRFAHKMDVLGRVSSGMAHDFNNFLTTVGVYAELVLKGLPPASPLREHALQIQETTRHASALTQQLLVLSRRDGSEAAVIDLNEAVAELSAMVRHVLPEEIEVDLRLRERASFVRADPDQLARVLMNLVLNARDAMPAGGRLLLETSVRRREELPAEFAAGSSHPEYVLLGVTDTGVGMDEETLRHAFEPFFTTKTEGQGTGLGLSIVYGIVEQAGGHVHVSSEPGKGTRFELFWPRCEEPVEPSAVAAPAPGAPAASGKLPRILLVEDRADLRRALAEFLSGEGYDVAEAGSGEEGLDLAGTAQRPFDVAVSDVVMPGMGGLELARRLERVQPGIRLLLTSGQASDLPSDGAPLPEGLLFLPKPFGPRELARRIRALLES